MKLLAWGRTDAGLKRTHNEDSFVVCEDLGLVAVADGMGGHVGGARASRTAVELLAQRLRALDLDAARDPDAADGEPEPAPLRAMREATVTSSHAIHEIAERDSALKGMGTTLTALLVHGDRGYLAHVGDSRAYLYREGEIRQLSEDHSWVQEQTRAGYLTDEQARTSKYRHVITRSVGYQADVQVDLVDFPVLMGDCFLLCSDGLSGPVKAEEMAGILAARFYRDAPEALVRMANERGGEDNVTVVVAYAANV